MDPEISPEEEVEVKPKRKITWRRVGLSFLFILATAVVFAAGYLAVILLQKYFPGSSLASPNPYENWLVYRSETYGLGLRYPDNWEAAEVKTSFATFANPPLFFMTASTNEL